MIPLKPEAYPSVRALIRESEIRSHLAFAHALLEGRHEGGVYGDDETAPRTVLLWPASGFFFAFGDSGNGSVARFLPELLARPLPRYPGIYATSAAWREALGALFDQRVERIGFELAHTAERLAHDAPPLPREFTLAPMDAGVGEVWSEGLDTWGLQVWGGPKGFAAKSFGIAVMHEGRIASFCAACGIGGGEAEVEIATVPRFQRMGLATAAARAFMTECRHRGLRPTWSCGVQHTTSAALARKLGFVEIEVVQGYELGTW